MLLVGDAIYDFHNRLGTGKVNFVPSFLTFTKYKGETATDEWYVTVSGDDAVPDLYIGRLPAASAAEAAIMVDKIVAYETAANTKGWEKDVLRSLGNKTVRVSEWFPGELNFPPCDCDRSRCGQNRLSGTAWEGWSGLGLCCPYGDGTRSPAFPPDSSRIFLVFTSC